MKRESTGACHWQRETPVKRGSSLNPKYDRLGACYDGLAVATSVCVWSPVSNQSDTYRKHQVTVTMTESSSRALCPGARLAAGWRAGIFYSRGALLTARETP